MFWIWAKLGLGSEWKLEPGPGSGTAQTAIKWLRIAWPWLPALFTKLHLLFRLCSGSCCLLHRDWEEIWRNTSPNNIGVCGFHICDYFGNRCKKEEEPNKSSAINNHWWIKHLKYEYGHNELDSLHEAKFYFFFRYCSQGSCKLLRNFPDWFA